MRGKRGKREEREIFLKGERKIKHRLLLLKEEPGNEVNYQILKQVSKHNPS